jgi:hypothetical protein
MTGGEGREAQRFHQHLAALITDKRGKNYGVVRNIQEKVKIFIAKDNFRIF